MVYSVWVPSEYWKGFTCHLVYFAVGTTKIINCLLKLVGDKCIWWQVIVLGVLCHKWVTRFLGVLSLMSAGTSFLPSCVLGLKFNGRQLQSSSSGLLLLQCNAILLRGEVIIRILGWQYLELKKLRIYRKFSILSSYVTKWFIYYFSTNHLLPSL